MSQQEILDLLKKNPVKWWTARELMIKLGKERINRVWICLGKLRKTNFVQWKEKIRNRPRDSWYLYKYKQ